MFGPQPPPISIDADAFTLSVDPDLVMWFEARDFFLGLSNVQDIPRGLAMARKLNHKDAQWLCGLFKTDPSPEQAQKVFKQQKDDGGRSMVYAALVHRANHSDREELLAGAKLGCFLGAAEATMWGGIEPLDQSLVLRAAFEGSEPTAYYHMAFCTLHGSYGYPKDLELSKKLFLKASLLGHHTAQSVFAEEFFDFMDPERYVWAGRALPGRGSRSHDDFFKAAVSFVAALKRNERSKNVLYQIGKSLFLFGDVDPKTKSVCGRPCKGEKLNACVKAVEFYETSNAECKKRVEAFMIVGKRMKLYKDVIGVIAKLIWDRRSEVDEDEAPAAPEDGKRRSKRAKK